MKKVGVPMFGYRCKNFKLFIQGKFIQGRISTQIRSMTKVNSRLDLGGEHLPQNESDAGQDHHRGAHGPK